MQSLQRQVIVGGMVWAILATVIGSIAVSAVFDQIANRRFNESLSERLLQVIVALGDVQTPDGVEAVLTDPAYARVYSGRYWQIVGENGEVHTSASLFDSELRVEQAGAEKFWEGVGPEGPVRGLREEITLDSGSVWSVSVASSLATLAEERSEVRRNVALAFGFVGVLGIAGAALLTSVIVAPLRKLSEDVKQRWSSENSLVAKEYPVEVAPLVEDINELIDRNRDILNRGRRQAADLAHALKTPSAVLRNQLEILSQKTDGTEPLFEALDRVDAQIVRSLARMRAATAQNAVHTRTDVDRSVNRIERLFRSLPDLGEKEFLVDSCPSVAVIDAQDLEEILGNLLENAFKWSVRAVHLSVKCSDGQVHLVIEDDGPGIDKAERAEALKEGKRLDTSVPGTGLGLAIANDLTEAYGGTLHLSRSKSLGGLSCHISLPVLGGKHS